jgi:hypothetical protein
MLLGYLTVVSCHVERDFPSVMMSLELTHYQRFGTSSRYLMALFLMLLAAYAVLAY